MKKLLLTFYKIIGLCLAISLFTPVYAQETDIKSRIEKLMKDHDAIGMSVVVVKDNEIVYYGSFGYNPDYSDPAKRKPIRQDDVNYIASISKTFVATAIMQLVERGKLSLDDDVNNYLDFSVRNPSYPDVPITVRMLLTHRSSLNKLKGAITFDHFNLLIPEKNRDYKKCYNDYKPGADYDYCNFGYVILGAIIEKASGMRFDTFIEENIMRPLNLYGSFNIEHLDSSRFVKTYRYKNNKYIEQPLMYMPEKDLKNYVIGLSTPALHPADGMIISSTDLAKFMLMHMNDGKYKDGSRIISKESERIMRTPGRGNKTYGLALSQNNNSLVKGDSLIGMNGGSRGMHTSMYFCPEKKYGFVVFCNGCNSQNAGGSGLNKPVIKELYKFFIEQ